MPIRLSRFEMPRCVSKDKDTATGTYARFVAEPFEIGYARTIGNSLRRVLLSSIEGCAISSVRIAGVSHEFSTIKGCAEDVTDIILNLKRVLLKTFTREATSLHLKKKGPCTVYAGDFAEENSVEVLNPRQEICTLEADGTFDIECELRIGRGFCLAEANKTPDQEIGRIAIDSIFSPVTRVNFLVENTRVGQRTDYEKLVLDVWTDGRVTPDEALKTAALSGIDVRLMIPNKPDHPFVYWVTYNNAASLMECGVKVYIYNKGFLHSKCITVDDEVSSVGSANFDIRSFKLNFECNAVIYDKDIARQLHNAFFKDMEQSTHLTPVLYAQRTWDVKVKESVGRLISDIL